MERVKDVSQVRMYQGSVLIKINLKNTKIVAPDQNTPGAKNLVEYAEIIAVSSDVTDLKVGDIVLDFRSSESFEWNKEHYAIIPRMNIKIAVDKDNFDATKKKMDKSVLKKLN